MKSIRHNTVFLVAANSLQVALSLLLSIFLARYFGDKEIFGKYQQLFIIINFLISLSSGIPTGLSYFYGKYLDYTSRIKIYKRFGWSLLLLALFFGSILAFSNNIFVEIFQNNFFHEYFAYFCILLTFKIMNAYFLQFYLTRGKLFYYFSIIVFEFIVTVIYAILIYQYNLPILYILLGLTCIAIAKFLLFSLKAFKFFKVNGPLLLTKEEFNYILPMTAISMASALTIYTDKFMISSLLNPESFAEYQVGAFSIPFIGIITGSVVTALIPALSRLKSENKTDEIVEQMLRATQKTTLFLIPILVYCIFLGRQLITILYTDDYLSSGAIFQLYTSIYLLTVIAFSAVMSAIGLQKWVFVNTIINLVVNIILNYILIPIYGSFGAVYATMASTYLGYFLPIFLLKKHISANFFDYFPWRFYAKVLLLSISLASLVLLVIDYFQLNKWIAVFAAIPFYIVIILLCTDKNSNDLNQILKRIKKIGKN